MDTSTPMTEEFHLPFWLASIRIIFICIGILAMTAALASLAYSLYEILWGVVRRGEGWFGGVGEIVTNFMVPVFGLVASVFASIAFNVGNYMKQLGRLNFLRRLSFILVPVSFLAMLVLLQLTENRQRKTTQARLTLSSTRTPPALSSVLSHLLAISTSFSASAQAGPVSYFR